MDVKTTNHLEPITEIRNDLKKSLVLFQKMDNDRLGIEKIDIIKTGKRHLRKVEIFYQKQKFHKMMWRIHP